MRPWRAPPQRRTDVASGAQGAEVRAPTGGRRLEFWYDFASTYSYLSAMRIEALAAAAGVTLVWRPLLLGPIFSKQGWSTSPFNLYPAKGRYMIRDLERVAAARGMVFHIPPSGFPANSVTAARLAYAVGSSHIAAFTRAVFVAEFATGEDIADPAVLSRVCTTLGLDFARLSEVATSEPVKPMLRAATAEAEANGIFGAPTFRTADGEIFWGDDRLEQALAWCVAP